MGYAPPPDTPGNGYRFLTVGEQLRGSDEVAVRRGNRRVWEPMRKVQTSALGVVMGPEGRGAYPVGFYRRKL